MVTTESGPQVPHPPDAQPPDAHPQSPTEADAPLAPKALPAAFPARQLLSLHPPSLPPPAPLQPVKPITAAKAANINMDRIFQILLKSGSAR